MLVALTCPMPSSGHQEQVVVFTAGPEGPAVLGVLRDEVSFADTALTTGDRTVTLSGPTWSGNDATCCPGHWATVTYRWTGEGFTLAGRMEATTTQPFERGGLADGDHVGILTGVGEGEVLVDVVEWFDGATAEAACTEDGLEPSQTPHCHDYHYRNQNDLMRLLPVRDGAAITYVDWATMHPQTAADLASVGGSVDQDVYLGGAFFRFTVEAGHVTRMEERFVS
ncbi:LppP/LprE family lipoprotein [Geodermatophilus sp. SYSU D01180]